MVSVLNNILPQFGIAEDILNGVVMFLMNISQGVITHQLSNYLVFIFDLSTCQLRSEFIEDVCQDIKNNFSGFDLTTNSSLNFYFMISLRLFKF